jgi:hypothetical protein
VGRPSGPIPAPELRRRWLERAYKKARIDASHWDPSLGVESNRPTIALVYDYYGRLYKGAARLQWAGIAKLIAPSFYAGFLDIGLVPGTKRGLLVWLHRLIAAVRRGARPAGDGLRFFEVTFLRMQRKIFEDQALMHEAYLGGGLPAILELRSAGIIDEATAKAWEQIDGGDPTRIVDGNRTLLFREQHDIIERYYAKMRGYDPPQGRAFTYLLTLGGSPAIPGAKSYAAVFPLKVPRSGGAVVLTTPLPDGNIAVFANRWDLIAQDTWPAYQRLLADDPAGTRDLIAMPIEKRVGQFRLLRRLRIILEALLRWRIRLRLLVPRRLGVGRTVITAEVTIDLTSPPTRALADLPADSDNLTWASTATPFPLKVLLPRGLAYTTVARLAVLASSTRGGNPDRLTVKLPSADLEGARTTLDELAETWHADAEEVARWAAAAAQASPGEYAYATRVFRAKPIDFVRLELQVEHHVAEADYVVDVLFSWPAVTGPSG